MNEPPQIKKSEDRPPPPIPRSDWYAIYRRVLRSKHLRMFFVAAILVHLALIVILSQDFVFKALASDNRTIESTPWEIQEAMDTLQKVYRGHFTATYDQLVMIRNRLDEIQAQRLKSMIEGDAVRKQKIADGQWPTAEKPNRSIPYQPRADVTPPEIPVPPAAKADELALHELFAAHAALESTSRDLYERYHALLLARDEMNILPLSEALEKTSFSKPSRKDIPFHEFGQTVRNEQQLREYRKMLVDAYLETQDILKDAQLMLDEAEGKYALSGASVLFGDSVDIVPAPVPYEGDYLDPMMLEARDLKQLMRPEVVFGTRIGEFETSNYAFVQNEGKTERRRIDWMFVNRWWTVGPFQHPGHERRMMQLQHKYPPEQMVDLSHVYQGKTQDGKPRRIAWKYRVLGPPIPDPLAGAPRRVDESGHDLFCIRPYVADNERLGVWYFYTQIWSDRDQEVLASFASDDYGVCWINGPANEVYRAPPVTRPWVPFALQDFRVIKLRKGANDVLFKLENATGRTGFSMFIMTHHNNVYIRALQQAQRQSGSAGN